MSDILILRTLLLAVEALAASALLPALACVGARTQPNNAARRHLIWTAALAALLLFPLAAMAPSLTVLAVPAPAFARIAAIAAPAISAPSPSSAFSWPLLLIAGLGVWLLGAVWFALRGLAAAADLEMMRRRGTVSQAPLDLGGGGPCWELRYSDDCGGPLTWGVLRPVVMLPWAALHWTPARLDTVLRHELAHVRRRDGLAQALAMAACTLYWPNPLVWRAALILRREAELAADDAVIASGVRPSDYAGELLELAKEWQGRQTVAAGMAMAAPAALTQRVQSILSPTPHRTGATAMDAFKLVGIGCMTAAAMAAVRPSLAQTAAVKPPAPVAAAALPAAPAAPAAPEAKAAPHRSPHARTSNLRAGPAAETDGFPPEARAELDRNLANLGPTISKAIADAHIQELVAKQVAAQDERTRDEINRQMAELGPRIEKAIADAHIEESVAKRLAEMQPRIDAAMAKAQAAAEKARERSGAAPGYQP